MRVRAHRFTTVCWLGEAIQVSKGTEFDTFNRVEIDAVKTGVALFEQSSIRRVWHEGQWWFSVVDVVKALTGSKDPKGYIKDMRRRDAEISKGWGQIATPLAIDTNGGVQRITCAHVEGVLRIIQSIPSPKAEPFKLWLAKVGHERLQEIRDPELMMRRMRAVYEKKGYPREWIEKRMRGIAIRQELTKEWEKRGAKVGLEYAILTNEIMTGAFEMGVKEYKDFKGIGGVGRLEGSGGTGGIERPGRQNLRDHMNDMELILMMLAEATTTKIHENRDTQGFPDLKIDARDGGEVVGRTRKDIEKVSGNPVVSGENYLRLGAVHPGGGVE